VLAAAEQVNNTVGRLTNRQVSHVLGIVGVHGHRVGVHGLDNPAWTVIRDQTPVRPSLALIE